VDIEALEAQLQQEGFRHTYVWEDGPRASYPDHTHPNETAHVILSGEMILTVNGHAATYGVGERVDVPAGEVHSARMGAQGCRYLIGEK
jgi:quercetin dioxygenase-like cupin family protein